jgi:hypothetical protein
VGQPDEATSAFPWIGVQLNLPGIETYDQGLQWVNKMDSKKGDISTKVAVFLTMDAALALGGEMQSRRAAGDFAAAISWHSRYKPKAASTVIAGWHLGWRGLLH